MTFEEFYRNLGLTSYPFTTFTTELERDRSVELFVPMTEFGPIQESFRANSTIILLGERGVGKTAVLEEFHRQVRGSQVYAVINEYSELADQPDSSDFHSMILRHLLIAIVSYLGQNPHRARRMDKRDRVLVSYLIYYFSDELTVRSIKDAVDRIQIGRFRRLATNLFNRSRRPLNYAASVLESALKRYIAQNFNLVPFYDESVIHDYFPEIPLESDMSFREGVPRFQLLRRLCELILKSTGHKPIVLLDRLDEDSRLANDAEKIAAFVEPLLTDNNLLGLSELQTILFVWKTPYRFIAEKVRSQKYFCPSIKWDTAALKSVLNKRLEVFSEKRMTDHRELFMSPDSDLVGQAFRLANGVPRDLWHVMNKLFEEQFRLDPEATSFTDSAIQRAIRRFVTEFNYFEYYPRKANARRDTMDIYSYYAHLRKVGAVDFTKNQLNERAGTGSSTNNYLVGMERIGLVERLHQERGQVYFRITDSKVVYAIENDLDIHVE